MNQIIEVIKKFKEGLATKEEVADVAIDYYIGEGLDSVSDVSIGDRVVVIKINDYDKENIEFEVGDEGVVINIRPKDEDYNILVEFENHKEQYLNFDELKKI